MPRLRLALCQIDPIVGDIDGNVNRIQSYIRRAEDAGADLAVFPELAVTGYPPEDLVLKPAFIADNLAALEAIALSSRLCAAVVGFVEPVGGETTQNAQYERSVAHKDVSPPSPMLANAAAVCVDGRVAGVYHKRRLPNYGVFDEVRWFKPGSTDLRLYEVAGTLVGVTICEDIWVPGGPIEEQVTNGAALVVNLSASPYSVGRRHERLELLGSRVAEHGCAIAYVNQVGGQDELVFDGGSMVVDRSGSLVAAARLFSEEMVVVDVETPEQTGPAQKGLRQMEVVTISSSSRDHEEVAPPRLPRPLGEEEEIYEALVLGTRDYLAKNGFTDAVIGLSGGIDSSLVAVIATDALGASHVHGLSMPSKYSSDGSRRDARALADRLGIDLAIVGLEKAHLVLGETLADVLGGPPTGLADENLQSRLRGVLLMAVSNAKGWMVLTTGNKSELATGYSTLYGDSAGGFAVIRDVPKTLVYRLCRYRNERAGIDLVPEEVLTKAPSAELRPDQTDDQSLPPYEILDAIIEGLVEDDRSVVELVKDGMDAEVALAVARMVDAAEYKRRQSPPGVRITEKAFGKDRRMPITNKFRDRLPVEQPHSHPGEPGHDERDPGKNPTKPPEVRSL